MLRPGDALSALAEEGVSTMKFPEAGFFFFSPRCGCGFILESTAVHFCFAFLVLIHSQYISHLYSETLKLSMAILSGSNVVVSQNSV